MARNLDHKLNSIILKSINKEFYINDDLIVPISYEEFTSPRDLSEFIVGLFGVSFQLADYLTYSWLFDNGYSDIIGRWFNKPIVFNTTTGEINLDFIPYTNYDMSQMTITTLDHVVLPSINIGHFDIMSSGSTSTHSYGVIGCASGCTNLDYSYGWSGSIPASNEVFLSNGTIQHR